MATMPNGMTTGSGEVQEFEDDEPGLGRDHWLVSGRIDGIREALEVMRSGVSRNEGERLLEERISVLMNQP